MKTGTLPLLAFAGMVAFGGMQASAGALPVATLSNVASSDVVQVYHRGKPHRAYRQPRQRVVVYPHRYAYPDYYATSPGFQDPGFAVRGNLSGCATDLGYGRWESCDK